MKFITNLFSRYHDFVHTHTPAPLKHLRFLIMLLVILTVPVTIVLVQTSQDTRQRAADVPQYLRTINLTLYPNNIAPKASGKVTLNIMEAKDFPANNIYPRLRMKLNGTLTGLAPNRIFRVQVCKADGASCEADPTPEIKTDNAGNATFENLFLSTFSNNATNQFRYIKITEETSGIVPPDACHLTTNPCLQATWSEGGTGVIEPSTSTSYQCSEAHPWVNVKHLDLHLGKGFVNGGSKGITTILHDKQTGKRVRLMYTFPGKDSEEMQLHGKAFETFSTEDVPTSIDFAFGQELHVESWEGDWRFTELTGTPFDAKVFPAKYCDSTSATPTPAPQQLLPDFTYGGPIRSANSINVGSKFNIWYEVKNSGTAKGIAKFNFTTSPDARIETASNNTCLQGMSLSPGQRCIYSADVTYTQSGNKKVVFTIDPAREVSELSETNNESFIELTAFGSYPTPTAKNTPTPTPVIGTPTPTGQQTPTPVSTTPVNVTTPHASLKASDFTLRIGSRTYKAPAKFSSVTSDPGGNLGQYTTLESTWFQDGIEMRMNMYFKYDGAFWYLSELRTYNGKAQGDWIYYKTTDQFGQKIQHSAGNTYISPSNTFTIQSGPEPATLTLTNVQLWTSLGRPMATPTPGISSTPAPTGKSYACDFNSDNELTILDYTIWLNQFINGGKPQTPSADCNKNGIVDLYDYNLWLRELRGFE